MSSEGSVTSTGSQIRQFGLYRTIDARTEEFLRSSRKRQIKQGCACAAISTAITVTVVVSVILVYEYSINSEANITKNSINPHWIGLMNDSDLTSISSKFHKKINFDRTTLKLLPILLKALNKNRYLEKILEEYSGSSIPNAGKDTTEATFTRNIFSNSNNWLKLPNTRHYTLDYKTTPLMYWKNPTKRLEYLTKIRKIRDYQRMLNYFDKMVNERVGQKKEFDYTENPLPAVTAPMKVNKKGTIFQGFKDLIKNKEFKTYEDTPGCICPKKLGLLLTKLIASLQDIVPQILKTHFGTPSSCENKTKFVETVTQFTTPQTVHRTNQRRKIPSSIPMSFSAKPIITKTKCTTNSPRDISTRTECCPKSTNFDEIISTTTTTIIKTTPTTETTTNAATESTMITEQSIATTNDEFQVRSIKKSFILPKKKNIKSSNYQTRETTLDYSQLVKPTESPYFIQTTETPDVKHRTTEAILPVKHVTESYADEWLKGYSVSPNLRKNIPLFREEDYYDDTNNRPSIYTKFENINVQSVDSLKEKAIHSREETGLNENNLRKTSVDEPTSYTQSDLDLSSMRKMADMIYIPQEKTSKVWKYTIDPDLPVPSHGKYKNPILQAKFKVTKSFESNTPTMSTIFSSTPSDIVPVYTPTLDVKTTTSQTTSSPQPLGADQQINENGGDDELQEEYGLQPTENNANTYKYTKASKENKKQTRPWRSSKNEEKIVTSHYLQSMLPSLRPIYLEIQRNNEWRQDEHGDYDIYNFNHNILDMPN